MLVTCITLMTLNLNEGIKQLVVYDCSEHKGYEPSRTAELMFGRDFNVYS